MNIVSIDIGLKNLGMVEFWWDEHPRHFPELIKWHKVDLTMLPHKRVEFHACDIPHTNEMADLVAHFMQEYHPIFEKADVILLERQPPGGLLEIQSLLLFKYRRKAHLVSPNSVHAHFTMNHLDYEGRKERSLCSGASSSSRDDSRDEFSMARHIGRDSVCSLLVQPSKSTSEPRGTSGIRRVSSDSETIL
jgi:hypothetical protein